MLLVLHIGKGMVRSRISSEFNQGCIRANKGRKTLDLFNNNQIIFYFSEQFLIGHTLNLI
jgi:hypothetical protein